MKKILLSIAASVALFSCGSESPITPSTESEAKTVKFQVSAFNSSTEPLRAAITESGRLQKAAFTYAVYKSTGEFVKTNNYYAEYNSPNIQFTDELVAGSYKIIFAMQYVQNGEAFTQPNLNNSYNSATFEYSPSSDCFFKTYDLTITDKGEELTAQLPRITGATEIYITNIESIGNLSKDNIKIGAFNIPNAFKISDLTPVTNSPNQFEKEFRMVYYYALRGNYYYPEGTTSVKRPFPAVFSGGFNDLGICEGGIYPETFYRYIHTMPTTDMFFKISVGSEYVVVSDFEVKANTLTKLTGGYNVKSNVSVNTNWETTPIDLAY